MLNLRPTPAADAPQSYGALRFVLLDRVGAVRPSHGGSVVLFPLTAQTMGVELPGAWLDVVAPTAPVSAIQVLGASAVLRLLVDDASLYVAETRGEERPGGDDRFLVPSARLLRRVGPLSARVNRVFAVDCARSVIHHVAEKRRPVAEMALQVAESYARGNLRRSDLETHQSRVLEAMRRIETQAEDLALSAVASAMTYGADPTAAYGSEAACGWTAARAASADAASLAGVLQHRQHRGPMDFLAGQQAERERQFSRLLTIMARENAA